MIYPVKLQKASVLVLVVVSLVILTAIGLGLLTVSYGVRHRAIAVKSESIAMLAAEAGYEEAIFRMSQQPDMLGALNSPAFDSTGNLTFADSYCDYTISFYNFVASKPVYRVLSEGYCGNFNRVVEVYVVQAVSGWDMGMCRVPSSSTETDPVYYANGEIIDILIHINKLNDNPDEKDIYISGAPQFLDAVEMGESRYTDGDSDKYSSVMGLFDNGIYFDQPDSRITDEDSVAQKVVRFKDSTLESLKLKPQITAPLSNPQKAVQLEFFVEGGAGKVRITEDCTVRGFRQSQDSSTWDYIIKPGSGGNQYERYDIYGYHVMPQDAEATGKRRTIKVEDTYVSQSFGGVQSEPGGQIFVDGNVIIGGDSSLHSGDQLLKGKMTVVATGNIWIADSIKMDGERDGDGMPNRNNPNVLGLVSQKVIRVVDPGMSECDDFSEDKPVEPSGYKYVPIGIADSGEPLDSYERRLPSTTVIEGALTVGGGGFGAENVRRGYYGDRKEAGFSAQDNLLLRGTLSEALRGVVGLIGKDGYLKHYYMDKRLLEGILPSDFWLKGKYIPAPAGWHDYRI
ncbi:MAG: hypothetical protein JW804_02660 [Sedimentisphaerales bacterium]|nr:hypothetical protein [Sedimentisphaerales bacterium]